MKNKVSKFSVLGAVGIVAALTVRSIKNNDAIDLKKSKEQILAKKDDIKNLTKVKNVCSGKRKKICSQKFYDKFPNKVQDKFDKLKGSLFNKQSSTSVVFGNPVYNLYNKEGGNSDGQE